MSLDAHPSATRRALPLHTIVSVGRLGRSNLLADALCQLAVALIHIAAEFLDLSLALACMQGKALQVSHVPGTMVSPRSTSTRRKGF
jgi:hypothetical protein